MLALAYPLLASFDLGVERRTFVVSVAVVLVTSLAAMLFRRRLFSLPRTELRFVVLIHCGRIAATTLLAAWMGMSRCRRSNRASGCCWPPPGC